MDLLGGVAGGPVGGLGGAAAAVGANLEKQQDLFAR